MFPSAKIGVAPRLEQARSVAGCRAAELQGDQWGGEGREGEDRK